MQVIGLFSSLTYCYFLNDVYQLAFKQLCIMPQKQLYISDLRARAAFFLQLKGFDAIAEALGAGTYVLLRKLATEPAYHVFYIPKRNGTKRLIEDPNSALKRAQRRLNDYLQAVYFQIRTPAAFGFLVVPEDDNAPRHILTNAQAHLGSQYMLNIDLKDFFHQISRDRVVEIFRSPVLDFNQEEADLLADICCYRGRLPMGAPTSPVLSNLAAIPLDQDLQHYCAHHQMRYTRYADDMTFSSTHQAITAQHEADLKNWITNIHGYVLHPDKYRLTTPDAATHEVTGLLIKDHEITLSAEYFEQLTGAIDYLSVIIDAQYLTSSGSRSNSLWVKELQQQVRGKLEFARHILGNDDMQYKTLLSAYHEALQPTEHYGPLSWLDFGYGVPHIPERLRGRSK
jgi:RNA-directed DNA polymerase